jgi:hypothetical protein
MLFPSSSNSLNVSDSALLYNFLENTWAQFSFFYPTGPLNDPDKSKLISCLGIYNDLVVTDKTWAELTIPWEDANFPWNNYLLQDFTPTLLGGSQTGIVYLMSDDESGTDDGQNINTQVLSTRLNPFIGTAQKVQFGYIDFYYYKNDAAQVTLNFYADNSNTIAATRTLTFDGPTSAQYNWKRVYINLTGEFLQMEIIDSSPIIWKINGMVLWARPAGRLTPGFTV